MLEHEGQNPEQAENYAKFQSIGELLDELRQKLNISGKTWLKFESRYTLSTDYDSNGELEYFIMKVRGGERHKLYTTYAYTRAATRSGMSRLDVTNLQDNYAIFGAGDTLDQWKWDPVFGEGYQRKSDYPKYIPGYGAHYPLIDIPIQKDYFQMFKDVVKTISDLNLVESDK